MKHILAFVLGVVAGGILVAKATNAIPKMMQNMMAHMEEKGHSPMEM